MFSTFTDRPLQRKAYSDRPFSFLTPAAQQDLSSISAIDLIENGSRAAREDWQNKQLTNLLKHAHAGSKFWRQRMPSRLINHRIMKYLPTQSRKDIATQVELEGSIAARDGTGPISSYASSGSTGTPVKVFICAQNAYYNGVRGLAQYFIRNLSLEENHVRIVNATNVSMIEKGPMAAKASEGWAGPLSKVFRTGLFKEVTHVYDDDALINELLKDRVGYLNCQSRFIEIFLKKGGVDLIKALGIKLWSHFSDFRDPDAVEALASVGVPTLSNYSAGECGPIAFECSKFQGYYHVAHSNVIVERDDTLTTSFNGVSVGRLLVTHLHSYATPIIRYDIGDFAQVENQCPCGHDGPTILNIFGRGKHFLRHPNGKFVPFYLRTPTLLAAVPNFTECRIIQKEIDTITVEIGGRESVTALEEHNLTKLIIAATDPAFKVKIDLVKEIDWKENPKHLFFSSFVS